MKLAVVCYSRFAQIFTLFHLYISFIYTHTYSFSHAANFLLPYFSLKVLEVQRQSRQQALHEDTRLTTLKVPPKYIPDILFFTGQDECAEAHWNSAGVTLG